MSGSAVEDTFAHAIEQVEGYSRLHGAAVGVGIVYTARQTRLDPKDLQELSRPGSGLVPGHRARTVRTHRGPERLMVGVRTDSFRRMRPILGAAFSKLTYRHELTP